MDTEKTEMLLFSIFDDIKQCVLGRDTKARCARLDRNTIKLLMLLGYDEEEAQEASKRL
jgi:hypothetical protein